MTKSQINKIWAQAKARVRQLEREQAKAQVKAGWIEIRINSRLIRRRPIRITNPAG